MELPVAKFGSRSDVEEFLIASGEDPSELDLKACYETRGHREIPEVCYWMINRKSPQPAAEGIVSIEPVTESNVVQLPRAIGNGALSLAAGG